MNIETVGTEKQKLVKEILELNLEIEKIQSLILNNRKNEARDYIDNTIAKKYFVEKVIHNMTYTTPPKDENEYIENALLFLNNLKMKKEVEITEK